MLIFLPTLYAWNILLESYEIVNLAHVLFNQENISLLLERRILKLHIFWKSMQFYTYLPPYYVNGCDQAVFKIFNTKVKINQ